jgi:hypothetical protein
MLSPTIYKVGSFSACNTNPETSPICANIRHFRVFRLFLWG